MASSIDKAQVEAVRSFNRFYTRQIGALDEGLLDSPFTLTQARVLFELAHRAQVTANEICKALALDAGYLSRILRDFEKKKLVSRQRSAEDSRRVVLSLTPAGRNAFKELDRRAHRGVSRMLSALQVADRQRLIASLDTIQRALQPGEREAKEHKDKDEIVLRTHRPGDIGWAIERHGQLYADEYNWNVEFEALVASLFANFVLKQDPRCERMWIAELAGERVGCVFVVRNESDPSIAQLRCLLVDPKARGKGVGRRLVQETIRFSKQAGYKRMLLWTNDILVAARRIYEAEGFHLTHEERHHSFGHDLVGQTWMRDL